MCSASWWWSGDLCKPCEAKPISQNLISSHGDEKATRQPLVLFCLLSQNAGTPCGKCTGRCWAGKRTSVQGKEHVGREGRLRLMSKTLAPVKGAVPSAPETVWCCNESSWLVFTGHEQFKSQKQCLLIWVLEERLSHTLWQAAQWSCASVGDSSEQSPAQGMDVNSGWLLSISVPPFVSPPHPPEVIATSMQLMEGKEQTTEKWRVNLDENVTHEFWPKHSLIQRKASINIYRLKKKNLEPLEN